jgi:nicotinate-nucleotide pyrophosphorylase (carboxylating)
VGDGDHTSLSTIPAEARGAAHLLVKSNGVLAGMDMAVAVCRQVDPALNLRPLMQDGARIAPGDVAFTLSGHSRSILLAERLLLNFMQRMSGIATLTRAFMDALEGTAAACWTPARPPRGCATSRNGPCASAAAPTTAWASMT